MDEGLNRLTDLCELCTVQITHRGRFGTGFFVAPGLLVTCAHVLGEGSAHKQTINFRWNRANHEGLLEVILPDPCPPDEIFPDIAVISHSIADAPCVLLDSQFGLDDELYSWGYSSNADGGESLRGTCEGRRHYAETPDKQLIKFKGTQVLPGISGSPLLNLKTGAVCGMIKRTRGEEGELGGLAIRCRLMLDVLQDIASQNRAFHERDPVWRRTIGRRQAEQPITHRGPNFVNRESQEREFVGFWREAFASRPGTAQIFLLPSADADYPEKFTERLHDDTVERLARSFRGFNKASIDHLKILSEPSYQKLESLKQHICLELFTEFEELQILAMCAPAKVSAKLLTNSRRLRLQTFVLIEHTINADSASPSLEDFLHWYLDEFWAGFKSDTQVIVFLHLAFALPRSRFSALSGLFSRWNASIPSSYKNLDRHLANVLPQGEANVHTNAVGAPVKRLSPLAPIQSSDINRWLRRLGISPTEIHMIAARDFPDVINQRNPQIRFGQIHRRLNDLYTWRLNEEAKQQESTQEAR